MSLPRTRTRVELDRLLSAFCEGQLDAGGRARIAAILSEDQGARRYYLRYLDLHMDLARRVEIGKVVPFEVVAGAQAPDGQRRWLLAAAAALIALAGIGIGAALLGNRDAGPPVADLPAAAAPVAFVSRVDSVRWSGIDAEPSVGLQIVPSEIALAAGRLRIDLFDGTGISFEAPSKFRIGSAGEIVMQTGRVAVKRPNSGQSLGFSVRSPNAVFVDIGTEFAVSVLNEGTSQLAVLDGEVFTSLLGGDGDSLAERNSEKGEYLVVDSIRGIETAKLDPSDFTSMLASAIVPLPISAAYVDAILSAAPLGYWRFETASDGGVANEVGERHRAMVLGEVVMEGDAVNRAALFPGDDPARGLVVNDGFPSLNGNGEYSIELWVNPSSSAWGGLASLVSLPDLSLEAAQKTPPQHRMSALECLPRDKERWMKGDPETFSFFHRLSSNEWGGRRGFAQARESRGYKREHGEREHEHEHGKDHDWRRGKQPGWDRNGQVASQARYQPGRWHHVVAVRESGRVALYLDGQLEASTELRANKDDFTYDLIIGRYSLAQGWLGRAFSGHIDEVAIYDRALSADEVRHHHDLVRP